MRLECKCGISSNAVPRTIVGMSSLSGFNYWVCDECAYLGMSDVAHATNMWRATTRTMHTYTPYDKASHIALAEDQS